MAGHAAACLNEQRRTRSEAATVGELGQYVGVGLPLQLVFALSGLRRITREDREGVWYPDTVEQRRDHGVSEE